jgi:simple sugar transport system ATP-binding protein
MMFGQVPERSERPELEPGPPALTVEELSIHTYRLAIEDVNLVVRQGEVFGLAGLEGSGQRLLLQACAGLLKPDSGHILLRGEDIADRSYHALQDDGVAYIAAGRLEEGLVAGLTLTEHVVLAQPQQGFMIDWTAARGTTAERIGQYQVVGRPDSTADELSGGNQQRLLFALLNSPLKLLLLEHPTRGLDVRSADWIWQKLYQRRDDGTAILFMSADLDEIIERSDRIAVFFGGRMSRIVDARSTSAEELGYMIGGENE